jgi:hypothetical protein
MSTQEYKRAEEAVKKEAEKYKAPVEEGDDQRAGLVTETPPADPQRLSNPTNPNPAGIATGLAFTDSAEQNASAYPTEPETPGANPAHTSEGLKKMKGLEPYAPIKEQDAASKKGEVKASSGSSSSSPIKK